MQDLSFYKYQGTGNDFIMIDNMKLIFDENNLSLIRSLCDRRFGIGADGLILIQPKSGFDFEVVYFNSDGSQSFCGNGARCSVRFAKELGLFDTETRFYAIDGAHSAIYEGDDIVSLKMNDVKTIQYHKDDYFINTGSPHYIKYVDDVEKVNIIEDAHKIRYNEVYKAEGTNVNFVDSSDEIIKMRTYERGVEDETLSCGTGVTAVALSIADKKQDIEGIYEIEVRGGSLQVKFKRVGQEFHDIWLIGKAEYVFKGNINIE